MRLSHFFCCVIPVAASRANVQPVQQVLTMLGEMKAKGEKMREAEKKMFAEYKAWVEDRTTNLGFDRVTAERKIEELVATAEKSDSTVQQLSQSIATLDADLARLNTDKKRASEVRESERNEYMKTEADYAESVDALERAIRVLSQQAYDRPQAELLLQRMVHSFPGMTRVLALVQEHDAGLSRTNGAPAVAAYKFQANGIVDILEGLLKKFKTELDDLMTDERNRAHSYDLEMIHFTDTIAKYTADQQERVAARAATAQTSAIAKGELSDTRASLADDKQLLSDMTSTFLSKKATFETNQQVRAEELEAIGQAIKVIASPAVAESYASRVKLVQFRPSSSPAMLLQTGRSSRRVSSRQRAGQLLEKRARALSSQTLATLAVSVLSGSPFEKVIGMIEDLLSRLQEEAAAEATHKSWCDEELKKNKLKREKHQASVDRLTSKVDAISSQISTMGNDISTLAFEMADLSKAMTAATAHRNAEKEDNYAVIADAQGGVVAIKQALVILREFYSSQSAFLQVHRQVPAGLDEYKGMGGEKTGVIGMLEVIESDFARLEAETKAGEAQAANDYSTFMRDATADKEQKHKADVKLRLEKDQAEFEKHQVMKELALVDESLSKANEYYGQLRPSCGVVHVSYEERAGRREKELAALKEAYAILDGKTGS
eukprot:TRINITY_DN223_c0_g1_i1.p1 TRINITY_DN223_c0_g1~~TRINITY_DN223_c0_g1_i1.p1  ORF type:complete len:663 (-),score=133.89 TRINITY_DN223_c0_g1_i1:106-2094(-)